MKFINTIYNLLNNETEVTALLNEIKQDEKILDIEFLNIANMNDFYFETLKNDGYTMQYIKDHKYLVIYNIEDSDL